MRKRPAARLGVVLGTVLGATVLAGCGGSSPTGGGSGTSVVAAFYPFAYVAERVGGAHASVTNLTAPGTEPHDLELSPQQVVEVSAADLVIYEEGFQPAVDDAVEENAEGAVLEVTDVVSLAEDGDPHIWLDPARLTAVAKATATALAEADPDHAADYRRHADRLVADLEALDRDFRQGLADCERRTIVTSHAAFGYLAQRYDLRMVAIAGSTPHSEPSPARLAELQGVVEREGVTTVFSETLASPELAQTLAEEVGVRTAVLDPIEGLSDATADEDYLSLMRSNLATLQRANGCS